MARDCPETVRGPDKAAEEADPGYTVAARRIENERRLRSFWIDSPPGRSVSAANKVRGVIPWETIAPLVAKRARVSK